MFMRMTMNLLVLLLQNLVGTPALLAVASYVRAASGRSLCLYRIGLQADEVSFAGVPDGIPAKFPIARGGNLCYTSHSLRKL